MTITQIKILSVVASIIALIAITSAVSSNIALRRLETKTRTAISAALEAESKAAEIEKKSYEYKQQIRTLENSIKSLRQDAAAQDAKLDRLADDTDSARRALRNHRTGSNKKQ